MAARNAAKSASCFPRRAFFLTNFHSRSMRFMFGKYDGRYSNTMPNRFVTVTIVPATASHARGR